VTFDLLRWSLIQFQQSEHENLKIQFDRFIFTLAEELEIEIKSAGSTTLKQRAKNRVIEPDNCYYIQNEPAVSREKLDLETDLPPDLAIEIDITHSSVN
jgi:Uma2 family endonuclease